VVSEREVEIYAGVLNKNKVPRSREKDREELYNLGAAAALADVRWRGTAVYTVHIIADSRGTSSAAQHRFAAHRQEVLAHLKVNVEVTFRPSTVDKGVRVADYIAGALYQQYERGNDEYVQILTERIAMIEEVQAIEDGKGEPGRRVGVPPY